MTANKRSSITSIEQIWDDVIGEVENLSDNEIIESCKNTGGDPAVIAMRTKERLLSALSLVGKERFKHLIEVEQEDE